MDRVVKRMLVTMISISALFCLPRRVVSVGETASMGATAARSFSIDNDQFILDGKPIQLISGSIHYFRIHPAYWRDRLERCKALGLNTVEIYVPWNFHEPHPEEYLWEGPADVAHFIELAAELGFLVQCRAGPYICAEWDNGGFPWWFGSSEVAGGRTMKLRSNDPVYLEHVDRWWAQLLARIRPYLLKNGGPIIMLQIENEYGFCGNDDKSYMRHLAATARRHLGDDVLLYTTDPAHVAAQGTLPGDEVFSAVDFGPGWFQPVEMYGIQKDLNAPGKSPPLCSEFYTGWLSHWGEDMANTSAVDLAKDTQILLEFANNTGNLNFYMVHGGTNFGFWAGANIDGTTYQPHITSYDYDGPISENGDYCQSGIGGDGCKYQMIQQVIAKHTGKEPLPLPPRPTIRSYGTVAFKEHVSMLQALSKLRTAPILVDKPTSMEEYGQPWGFILYRTNLNASFIHDDVELDLGPNIHDYATVFIDGNEVGRLERGGPAKLKLSNAGALLSGQRGDVLQLDVLVHAMGRQNFGCDMYGAWDLKGLQTRNVKIDDVVLMDWKVYPMPLEGVSSLPFNTPSHNQEALSTSKRRRLSIFSSSDTAPVASQKSSVPVFFRSKLAIQGVMASTVPLLYSQEEHLADTYVDMTGWGKGLVWINGFNLGWYWSSRGPQMTLYVPGPILTAGDNEVIVLEVESMPQKPVVTFTDAANFNKATTV